MSVLEMLRNYAFAYVLLSDRFESLAVELKKIPDEPLTATTVTALQQDLDDAVEAANIIDLHLTAKLAKRMRDELSTETQLHAVVADYRTLRARFQDELETKWFLYVPLNVVPYYGERSLERWGDVGDKFPSAQFEIREAGSCFALGRHTACVLHLMRSLEPVLKSLAAQFRVKYDQASWATPISMIDKRIRMLEQAKRKPANWKRDRQFYSEVASEFRLFKDAWRNYSVHGYQKYNEEEARIIYEGVRAFMRHAATKLSEAA